MIKTLFILNDDGDLEVSKPEARSIPEFEVLFKRDKGSIGDSGGRKKHIACGELKYIYFVHDIRSLHYNLPLLERKEKARILAKLPKEWKEDKELQAAVDTYLEYFYLTSSGKSYAVAERAYYSFATDIEDMQNGLLDVKALLQAQLKKTGARTVGKLGDVELVGVAESINAIIKEMSVRQKEIMTNIALFEKMGVTVTALANKFVAEGGNLKTPVGGGELGNRE